MMAEYGLQTLIQLFAEHFHQEKNTLIEKDTSTIQVLEINFGNK